MPSLRKSFHRWIIVMSSENRIPNGAIKAGVDGDSVVYVARAPYQNSLTPGKLTSEGCFIAWGCNEHEMDTYEVLCSSATTGVWVPTEGYNIPEGALKGGFSETGEILYVGRAEHEGRMIPGKVAPSHQVCYVPYDGNEIAYSKYEIYVVDEEYEEK